MIGTSEESFKKKCVFRRIKLFSPNEGQENGCTQIKSDELGYIISFRILSKEDCHKLAARVHTLIFNLDSGEEELLCSGKVYKNLHNYLKSDGITVN